MIKLNEIISSDYRKKIESLFGEDIPSDAFIWENYIGTIGYSDDEVLDFNTGIFKNGFESDGWTDASKLQVRPRDGIALMVINTENGDRFWMHYPELFIKIL